ncbi:hypothetical protein IV37_GL000046 [Fructilactobacillus fructivorans]|uniref:hypothetical protein n=1 Tax=Fructilactobacillus fructivorans TaxID=1614 RepID=UPI0007049E66|nr:hypothetical protein [Fructilactobacillus fructivorans]KRN13333.1 hypothetical protein IV37_GL000046 [Fructilactobacillus fructivorans]
MNLTDYEKSEVAQLQFNNMKPNKKIRKQRDKKAHRILKLVHGIEDDYGSIMHCPEKDSRIIKAHKLFGSQHSHEHKQQYMYYAFDHHDRRITSGITIRNLAENLVDNGVKINSAYLQTHLTKKQGLTNFGRVRRERVTSK